MSFFIFMQFCESLRQCWIRLKIILELYNDVIKLWLLNLYNLIKRIITWLIKSLSAQIKAGWEPIKVCTKPWNALGKPTSDKARNKSFWYRPHPPIWIFTLFWSTRATYHFDNFAWLENWNQSTDSFSANPHGIFKITTKFCESALSMASNKGSRFY